jgi:uncharacterized membrane protein
MSKTGLNKVFFVFGVALTAFSSFHLGRLVGGVTWEIAAFAGSIILSAASIAGLQSGVRIDDLEKKVSELENARKAQA